MPSPFPGMDPYLEGYLWPDVHHRLTAEISRKLTPRLRPRYVARLEISVVVDTRPEAEIGIMYPDEEAAYDLSIDYAQPPPPELSADERAWLAEQIQDSPEST